MKAITILTMLIKVSNMNTIIRTILTDDHNIEDNNDDHQ
jgi:hypothetical protein